MSEEEVRRRLRECQQIQEGKQDSEEKHKRRKAKARNQRVLIQAGNEMVYKDEEGEGEEEEIAIGARMG